MLYKYLRYGIIGLLILLGGATAVGLLSSRQPATTIPQKQTISETETQATNIKKHLLFKKLALVQEVQTPLVYTSTVILGGDIMLSRTIGYQNKKQGYNRIFSGTNYNPITAIPSCSRGACLLIMNLESPFSQHYNDLPEKTFTFKANTENIVTLLGLRQNNTMIVSLANNHINNAGGEGVITTRNILNEYNFYHVGAGSTPEEAKKILTVQHNNITRCISAYSYDGNGGLYGGKQLYWNRVSLSGMLQDIAIMNKTIECDIKAMILHRGREYGMKPNQEQITQAHSLIDNGLDILIGGHAHVPGRLEQYKGKYIFYSLGNALFDQDWGMYSTQAGMDTIYDAVLQRNAVPTYISIFPEILATKSQTGTSLQIQNIHGARVEKGIYSTLDEATLQIISKSIID